MIWYSFNWSMSTTHQFSLLLYSNIKVYHDGAVITSSAVDAILILMRMSEYYQIADDAPFTSNGIDREQLRLLTELSVSDCRVLDGVIGWQKVKHSKLGWRYSKQRYSRRKHSASRTTTTKTMDIRASTYRAVETLFRDCKWSGLWVVIASNLLAIAVAFAFVMMWIK